MFHELVGLVAFLLFCAAVVAAMAGFNWLIDKIGGE